MGFLFPHRCISDFSLLSWPLSLPAPLNKEKLGIDDDDDGDYDVKKDVISLSLNFPGNTSTNDLRHYMISSLPSLHLHQNSVGLGID